MTSTFYTKWNSKTVLYRIGLYGIPAPDHHVDEEFDSFEVCSSKSSQYRCKRKINAISTRHPPLHKNHIASLGQLTSCCFSASSGACPKQAVGNLHTGLKIFSHMLEYILDFKFSYNHERSNTEFIQLGGSKPSKSRQKSTKNDEK